MKTFPAPPSYTPPLSLLPLPNHTALLKQARTKRCSNNDHLNQGRATDGREKASVVGRNAGLLTGGVVVGSVGEIVPFYPADAST